MQCGHRLGYAGDMKLHGTAVSPYARKVRLMVLEKGIACEESIYPDLSDPNSDAKRLNPLGKVPVLELDDGTALFDSVVIAEFLDAMPGPRLVPIVGPLRWRTLTTAALADGLMDAVVSRLLEKRRDLALQSEPVFDKEEARVARILGTLEELVNPEKPFLCGDGLTLADLAVAAAIGYLDFRYPHDWRATHLNLAAWFEVISLRPSLAQTAPPIA